jgi:hypothetical protein
MKRAYPKIAFLLTCLLVVPSAHAGRVTDIDKGVFVGDGMTKYNVPYDPKDVSEVTFVAPTAEHPLYEIVVPLGDWSEGAPSKISEVRVNGLACESFYIFVDGFAHVHGPWLTHASTTAPNVVLVARMLWHSDRDHTIEIDVSTTATDGKAATVTKTATAIAPAQGGGPEGWRRYQSFVVHETAGVARNPEPVEFSIAARAENCGDLARELRVFAMDAATMRLNPTPFQVFNAKSFVGRPPGGKNTNYLKHPSRSIEVAMLAHVPANGSQVYVVTYDNPNAPEPEAPVTDLSVTGEALGAVVENAYYSAKLEDGSGQIAAFTLKGRDDNPVPTLTNSHSEAAHWNPDSFGSNGKWGHTFAWDPPEKTVVTARGPILFRVTNSGRMPDETPQVHASVSYSFYASVPYVKVATVLEVRETLDTSAIRNGELVLDSHLITHFVWEEKNGDLKRIGTLHGPNWQDEWTHRVEHDVRWLAMTHEPGDYGVGSIVVDSLAYDFERGDAAVHRPAYYLYYHHMWGIPLTYFTRAWVYPFSDYQRGPLIPVLPGSTYVERGAFMPFHLHKGRNRYVDIETASKQLQEPLVQRWGR